MSELDKLLQYDALHEAEKITGQDYKIDGATSSLGFALGIIHEHEKAKALSASDDTHYGILFADTLRIFTQEGFEIAHARKFPGDDGMEEYLVLWHPDGVLGVLESFQGNRTNTAKIYYNIEFSGGVDHSVTSSGGLHNPSYDEGRYVYVGDHDVREGLRFRLNRLRNAGTFQKQWLERPFLWFLDYTATRVHGYDYKSFNEAAIAEFPSHVRSAITPNKEH